MWRLGPFMVHAWRFSTIFSCWISWIREQHFSGTMNRKIWANSMACLFYSIKALTFLNLGAYKFYVTSQKSRTPRTWNKECRMDLKWLVRNLEFPARQVICLQKFKSCFESQGRHFAYFKIQEAVTRKPCFRSPTFIKHSSCLVLQIHHLHVWSWFFSIILYFFLFTNKLSFDSWIKIDQLNVTCFIVSLFTAQHVSNVSTFIFRSLRIIVDLSHGLYCSSSMCVGVTVWFVWGGVVSLCRLKLCFSLQNHPSRTTP